MKTRKPTAVLRSLVALTVALLLAACAQPALSPEVPPSATPMPSTETPLAQGAPTQPEPVSPTATEPSEPTRVASPERAEAVPPPVLAPVALAPCEPGEREPNSSFVTDLSLPDGSQLPPAARFSKTWRLRNSGTCAWPEGIALVLISGQPFGSPDRVPVPGVAAGREVDISVALTAPSQPGTYEGYWRLQTADGRLFGAVVFTKIEVVAGVAQRLSPSPTLVPATARPTASPTQTPTVVASPTPRPTATIIPTPPPPKPTATAVPRTPTPRPAATAVPTATPMPSPTPTATEEAIAQGACRPPDPRFASLAGQAAAIGVPMTCATGPVVETTGLLQAYWQNVDNVDPHLRFRSVMVARADTQQVYALDSEDVNTYQASIDVYPDTWTPAMPDRPEACAPLAAPQGYLMPIQGLGKVWCEQSMWNTLGWPREPAAAATLAIQETEHGVLIEVTTLPLKVYLIAADLDIGTATLQQVP